jgi:prepilin-type N-terminal cleavage/methylation domain-containing protein
MGCNIVAQVSNLLYRRLPACRARQHSDGQETSNGQPIGNRRYSRLETCATSKCRHFLRAGFTLIEIMVVVLIMGITLTMSVPIVYKLWHKAPMRQAVKDIFEVCQNARRRAIFSGQPAELKFHPRERRLEVTGATGEGTSVKLGDGVMIDLLDINMSGVEYRDADVAKVIFYPTGTSDEMKMVLRYEAEQIGIELELTTGLASVVSDPLRTWARTR